MPCLRVYGGAISIYFKVLGRNWGGGGLEVAPDVQLSLLQALHLASEQQTGGGRLYPLHRLSMYELELWLSEMWFLFRWFK